MHQSEQFIPQNIGLSSKEKRKLRTKERKAVLEERDRKIKAGETYGDIKVSRRIPKEITEAISQRDKGRDFGRPNHICAKPGPPPHYSFEKFLDGEIAGDPHTAENLEAPCAECHKLAHEMHIPSGVSVETFFRQHFNKPS